MTAWQQLPPDGSAEVVLEQLEAGRMEYGLPIGVLSYGWCGRSHPDEQGLHLQRLVPLLEAIVRECDCVGPDFTWGLVWDFASMPQRGSTRRATMQHKMTAATWRWDVSGAVCPTSTSGTPPVSLTSSCSMDRCPREA